MRRWTSGALLTLAAALSGCGGEDPAAAASAAPATTAHTVSASLRAETIDRDGDGVGDTQRTFEDLQPTDDVQLGFLGGSAPQGPPGTSSPESLRDSVILVPDLPDELK